MCLITEVSDVFKLFRKPIAKFDFIKLVMPRDKSLIEKLNVLRVSAGERFEVPASLRFKSFTLHDPTSDELDYLVSTFPDMEVEGLEVALDFYPLAQSNDLEVQWDLYRWLKKRLYPRQHPLFRLGCLRYNWCDKNGKFVRDRTLRMNGNGSYRYYTKNRYLFVRLYVKEIDQHKTLSNVPVRIEVHLDRGGCQDLGVHRLALFPDFVDRLRLEISPFFTLGAGIKLELPRFRSKVNLKVVEHLSNLNDQFNRAETGWNKYGAAFADVNDLRVISDRKWKLKIGEALQVLRNRHRRIKPQLAEKVEHYKNMFSVESATSRSFA